MNPVLYKPLRNASNLVWNESERIFADCLAFLAGNISAWIAFKITRSPICKNGTKFEFLQSKCFVFSLCQFALRNPAFCIYEMNKTIIVIIIFCSFWLLECKYWLWIVYLMWKKTSCLTWDCDKCSQIKLISLSLWTDFTFFLLELKSSLIFLQLLSHYVTF